MPSHQRPSLEDFEGRVVKTNDKGFQLEEYPGDWFNISQYADPKPRVPKEGYDVIVGVDKKGFVYTVSYLGDAPEEDRRVRRPGGSQGPQQSQQSERPPQNQSPQGQQRPPQQQSAPAAPNPTDLPLAMRTRALGIQFAVEFSAGRTDVNSVAVITVADIFDTYIRTGQKPVIRQNNPNPPEQPPA